MAEEPHRTSGCDQKCIYVEVFWGVRPPWISISMSPVSWISVTMGWVSQQVKEQIPINAKVQPIMTVTNDDNPSHCTCRLPRPRAVLHKYTLLFSPSNDFWISNSLTESLCVLDVSTAAPIFETLWKVHTTQLPRHKEPVLFSVSSHICLYAQTCRFCFLKKIF